MTTPKTLVVIGGWGVQAAMLEPLYRHWEGPVHVVSLTDDWLRRCDSPAQVAAAIVHRYPRPAVWLGWSLGAQVAMAAAQAFAESVAQVVTVGGFPQFIASKTWPCGVAPAIFRRFERHFEREPHICWQVFMGQVMAARERGVASTRLMHEWLDNGPPGPVVQLAKGVRWLRESRQLGMWQHCAIPALHLRGSHDAMVPPWTEHLAMPLHSRAVSIAGMGHWPDDGYAPDCLQAIQNFLSSPQYVCR